MYKSFFWAGIGIWNPWDEEQPSNLQKFSLVKLYL